MLTREISDDLRREYVDAGLWPNRPLFHFVDAAASRYPDKVAVADPYHRLSYRQFVELTKKLARVLLDVGVRPGDPVAIQAPNSVYQSLVHIAVNRVQGVYLPINEAWREKEVRHLLGKSQARVMFMVDVNKGFGYMAMLEALRPELPHLEHVLPLTIGADALACLPGFDDVLDDKTEAGLAAVPVDADAPRHVMCSSGTTSMPKLSEWSDNGLYAAFGKNYVDTAQLRDDDVMVGVAPASTGATGYVFAVLAPLLIGATSVLQDPWDPDDAVRLLDAEQATGLVVIPTQLVKMLASPSMASASLTSVRRISNGGAPLSEAHASEAEKVFGCPVHTMYGATDAGVPTMMDLDDPPAKRLTTVGSIVTGNELRIVGADNQPVDRGEPGEVVWRGAHKVLGYMNDEEATRAAFDADGWYHSGDLGVLDQEGFLRIVGRKTDMILRGGQNIFPGEIEEALARHPKVHEVAVAAIPDQVFGERACAFVIPSPAGTLTFDEMIDCVRDAGLVKYKWPEQLVILDEFPMSAGGKVQKSQLAALARPA